MVVLKAKVDWEIDNQEKRMKKGKLVKVQIRPGQYVKMYEADAITRGLLPGKASPQAENKMRQPANNKAAPSPSVTESPPEPADDFTVIPGVGPATARAMAAEGITTFEQLREASDLSFLPAKTAEAIEAWRNG